MEFLTGLLDNNNVPWITAMLLGLLTAISPCPLATNITAIGFISKNAEDRRKVFLNGLFYATGRTITYTGLALLILLGADELKFSGFFQKYGEKAIGPVLLIIGILMLDIIEINLRGISVFSSHLEKKKKWSYIDAVVLGLLLALAFCPYSGVLYFGILIPMSINSAWGLYLPVIFSIATAIPVIAVAWLIAFMISKTGNFYNKLKSFELWLRRSSAALFIIIGIYYIVRIYF
jgi:cytochrome c biogenesis protein CcdA